MEKDMQTDFAELAIPEEDVSITDDNEIPPREQENMIESGSGGTVYDYNNAPDSVAMPAREDLDGKTVEVIKAELVLPPTSMPWGKTRDGSKEIKACPFRIHYKGGQMEYYSGIRVFKSDTGKYSHPQLWKKGKNQASTLFRTYAEFVGKDVEEVGLKQFLSFLNSGNVKALIKAQSVTNPETEEIIKKNLIGEFVK